MAFLNQVGAIVVFARDTLAATQISCRRSDIPIIAVCDDIQIVNQLCLSRGVLPVFDPDLFAQRDAFNIARWAGIKSGKLVIVDGDKISLRDMD